MEYDIKKMKDRAQWLHLQIIHEHYYQDTVIKGFREELAKLVEEIKTKEGDTG